jgi:hypothetical protein
MCSQATIPTSLKQPSPSSHQEVIKVASSTSSMEDLKESNTINSNPMALSLSPYEIENKKNFQLNEESKVASQ